MSNLTQIINTAVNTAISKYVSKIVTEFEGIDAEELQVLWNEVSSDIKVSMSSTTKTKKSPAKSASSNEDGCPYEFQRGDKSGTVCGSSPKDGSSYCARHKKYEGQEKKDRKIVPAPKRSIKPKKVKSPVPKKVNRVLRKHSSGTLWHPETSLVFKSSNDRIVTGKMIDDKIVPLKEEDVDECKRWGFAFALKEKPEVVDSESDDEPEVVDSASDESEPQKVHLVSGGKFWEASVDGKDYTVRFGKVGAKGSTKTKTLESEEKALQTFEKEKAKKIKKGYSEEVAKPKKEVAKPKRKSVTPESPESSEGEETEEDTEVAEKYISAALGVDTNNVEETESEEEELLVSSDDE